jgi:hypothetical protein
MLIRPAVSSDAETIYRLLMGTYGTRLPDFETWIQTWLELKSSWAIYVACTDVDLPAVGVACIKRFLTPTHFECWAMVAAGTEYQRRPLVMKVKVMARQFGAPVLNIDGHEYRICAASSMNYRSGRRKTA